MRSRMVTALMLGLVIASGEQLKAECGSNPRHIIIDNSNVNLQVNDTLNLVAHGGLGGGCDIINWPTPTPIPGHFNNTFAQPSATAYWGDGQSTALNIATDGTFTGSHKYTQAVAPGTALKIVLTGYAWNTQRQWSERVTNNCDSPGINGAPWNPPTQCEAHPATIAVYPAQPPSSATPAQRITRTKVAVGALAIALQDLAPASGMKMTVSSPTRLLRVGDSSAAPPVAPGNPVVVVIPGGKSSFNFDVDATKVRTAGTYRIDISSAGKTVTVDVTVH